jgi:GTPase SAR1 family protein
VNVEYNEQQQRLQDTLLHVTRRLSRAGFPQSVVAQLEMLVHQVPQPCVVAVVGRVKAGKSSFLNALLGEDLAKVGATETTATINYFRGGIPNPQLPVRCYWRSGRISNENAQFLDDLQGNDMETLRRADGIDHLEYLVQNPHLQRITMVDTPGTGSGIDAHQNRTAEYMKLARQLRERHHQETQRIGGEADAVIYLIGVTATTSDRAFLEEFQQATQGQSRALNAIGVLAKIDLDEQVIQRREELSRKIAFQLQQNLNTVIPVSAGIRRALDSLLAQKQAGLLRMIKMVRAIPPDILEVLLDSSELYLDPACPVSVEERKQVRGEMPWRVFVTIARTMADARLDVPTIVSQLETLAGFDKLHEVLEQHFVKRGTLLRCYRVVNDALKMIDEIKYSYLREYRRLQAENNDKRQRFLYFLQHVWGASPVAQELAAFVEEQLAPRANLDQVIEEIQRELGTIRYELEVYNLDFAALQQIEDNSSLFTNEEFTELCPLFGSKGLGIEKRVPVGNLTLSYISTRQQYWDRKSLVARAAVLREVSQHAARRYGMLIETLI